MSDCHYCKTKLESSFYMLEGVKMCADCAVSRTLEQLSDEKAAREQAELMLGSRTIDNTLLKQRAETAEKARAEMKDKIKWHRPEVLAFAGLMERELRNNDHKPGWKDDHPAGLLCRVHQELKELQDVYCLEAKYDPNKLASEGADVANMLMMFLDVCGALQIASVSVVKDSFTTDLSIGRDYIHKSKLDAALAILEKCVDVMQKAITTTPINEANRIHALTTAEQILKENQDETNR